MPISRCCAGVLRSAGCTSELCPQNGFAPSAPSSFGQTEEESCWGEHWCMGIWPWDNLSNEASSLGEYELPCIGRLWGAQPPQRSWIWTQTPPTGPTSLQIRQSRAYGAIQRVFPLVPMLSGNSVTEPLHLAAWKELERMPCYSPSWVTWFSCISPFPTMKTSNSSKDCSPGWDHCGNPTESERVGFKVFRT